MENGLIEKKFEKDDSAGGSIGLTLRTGNATDSPGDYNKDAVFEFGFYQGKENYQAYDGVEQTAGPIQSLAIFDRNGEKNDAFFDSLRVARENK
jgi:hypothetical protein